MDETCASARIKTAIDLLSASMRAQYDAALAPFGLTERRYVVLEFFAEGGGKKQSSAQSIIGMDRSTLCEIVNRLISDGLLERRVSTEDRRVRLIAATKSGRKLFDECRVVVSDVDWAYASALPEFGATYIKHSRFLSEVKAP